MSWSRKIQGREFQAEGRVSTEPKGRRSVEAGGWPAGLGLGAKEWDSVRLGGDFPGSSAACQEFRFYSKCSGKGNPGPVLQFLMLL